MEILKFPSNALRGWSHREISLKNAPLKKASAFQISQLTHNRREQNHFNRKGFVLCVVVDGWMDAHCNGKNSKLHKGEGIVFEPGERHRINKGRGWMVSASSLDYSKLVTEWKKGIRKVLLRKIINLILHYKDHQFL